MIASAWAAMSLDRPEEVDKRRLAERYDFVAVIPRGLLGSSSVQCQTAPAPRFAFPPTHPDDANWQLMIDEAQAIADACNRLAHARYINTEQHVHDMDMVRRALGDERIHFYGISHGGLVGAWYASAYAHHAGRVLLDSTIDFTHDFRTSLRVAMHARNKAYVENTVNPLLDDAARYGLSGDRRAIGSAIGRIPARLREISVGKIDSPIQLAAVLHLATWWNRSAPPTLERMAQIIDGSLLAIDASLARRIRFEATRFASALYARHAPRPYFTESPEEWSVRTFMPCNDETWTRSELEIRETAQRDAARYYHATGIETLEELVCSRWGGPSSRAPSLAALDRTEPFLLLQSERDVTTPLDASSHILDRFSNARMLLVRDSNQHGIFNFARSSCIERTAAHYLLTGALPNTGSRVFSCEGTGGNPLEAIPGEPRTPLEQPVAMVTPSPILHDEL
jgi:pimeloyl-ACP methyl ester carboxylesterase